MKYKKYGYFCFVGFGLCIPIANWLIENVGTTCIPNGPCMIPVGPNIMAPSGVLMIGLALVLRDLVQRWLGIKWAIIAILAGAGLSGFIASPQLLMASVVAFLLSEIADLTVYTPLQKKGLVLAVVASSLVGLSVDSALFLWLAFDNLDFIQGQIIGKALMVFAAIPFIYWIRHYELREPNNDSSVAGI